MADKPSIFIRADKDTKSFLVKAAQADSGSSLSNWMQRMGIKAAEQQMGISFQEYQQKGKSES